MGYEVALKKSWEDLANLKAPKNLSVKFLADEYSVDSVAKNILSLSCNAPAKDFVSILILHYLAQRIKGLPILGGQWLTFRELSGVEGYYDAYHKRSIEPIIRKYGKNPDAIKDILGRLPGKISEGGDVSIIIEAFANVPVLIKLWKQDAEFGPDANMYFDASIKNIFCTEDIVMLAQMVASQL
ncbi:MAG: DUF3786 domain-containing protein [Candidatus Omnitrophica bacterium]|nr:DUF3786 domain-containing protein [Candidatus Omnitrophota bacterium]